MVNRMTAGDLIRVLSKLPADTLICCQSDEEGNRTMVTMNCFVDQVGRVTKDEYDGETFEFVGGNDIEGVNLKKDKGKYLAIIQPMY